MIRPCSSSPSPYCCWKRRPPSPPPDPPLDHATVQVDETDPESSLPVLAASDTEALKAHEGERAFVEGVVTSAQWSRSGKVMNINFEGVGDDGFLAAIFQKRRAAFDEAFDGDLSAALEGKRVRLEGPLKIYGGRVEYLKGRPEIILNQTSQITILDDDGQPVEPSADEETEAVEEEIDETAEAAEEPIEDMPGLKLRDD